MAKKLTKKQKEKRLETRIENAPIKKIPQKGNKKHFRLIITILIIALILVIVTLVFDINKRSQKIREGAHDEIPQGMDERGSFEQLMDACSGLSEGDTCEAGSMSGTCEVSGEGNLVCIPQG